MGPWAPAPSVRSSVNTALGNKPLLDRVSRPPPTRSPRPLVFIIRYSLATQKAARAEPVVGVVRVERLFDPWHESGTVSK